MMTKGYPELEKLYAMLGAKDRVICKSQVHFPHNYNYVTRALMYSWFNKHLKLGLEEPIVEEDFEPLTPAEFTVWDAEHPKPPSGEDVEAALLLEMAQASLRQLRALPAKERSGIAAAAFDVLIGRRLPPAGAVTREKVDKKDRGDFWQFTDLLRVPAHGEELPVVSFHPKKKEWNGKVVIWVDGAGKAGMFGADAAPRPEIRKLLDAGFAVMGADLLYQGEFLADGKPLAEQPKVKNNREFAGFTYGYSVPLFSKRVHDLLTLISFVANDEHAPKELSLVGVNGAGPLVAAARAQAGAAVEKAFVDTGSFRFGALASFRDPDFLPGALKYGDLPVLLALSAPRTLWVAGEKRLPEEVTAAYAAAGKPEAARTVTDVSAAVDALIAP
jgi:hypothetical protein